VGRYGGGEPGLPAGTRPTLKIAAIDLGSNSIHMVVVEVSASGGFHVVAGEREMVRLGAGALARGRLSAVAMRRGLEVLREYKRLAETQGADKILAVATSAIREAANGEDFLHRVGREIGIWPRAITGEAEARLIYLAALHSIHLEGQRALVVDIGGGSVELALGAGSRLAGPSPRSWACCG
jgi:exopolyphosphatase/guanosine-5'-triphosphate,3'-diphosphate pyrophosphatase